MPQPDTRLLQRTGITHTLARAVSSYSLVVLTAPMGYGKTTAARELLRQLGHRIFYLTVSPGLNTAMYLWDRACGQLAAQGSEMAPILQRLGFPADTIQLHRTLQYGREYLAGRPTLLVIDDYHYVESPGIHGLIEAMVREDIPGLRLLLISREKPPLPLEDLCLKGRATQFDSGLLCFTQEEASLFFQLHGITSKAVADDAWAFSEGWPAALWLGLQNYQTHGVVATTRNVNGLLESAVFSRYSDEEKRLLLQLSHLTDFTPRQAATISSDGAAPRLLAALQEKNTFLNYDPVTDSYRPHSLFKGFLTTVLSHGSDPVCSSIDRNALWRRTGQWFAAEGDFLQAVRAFAVAGTEEDLLQILQIFEQPGDGLLVMFDPEGTARICQSIPWTVRFRCPIGHLAFIYHYMSRVSINAALPLLAEAETRFAAEQSLSPDMKRRIQGEIALIHGIDTFNDLFAMRVAHKKAHALLQGRSFISHRRLIWTFGSPHAGFLYVREAGSYRELVELVEKDLHYYQDLSDGCSMGGQDLFRAELLLEQGIFKKVESHIMKAVYRASGKDQLSTIIGANFTLARLGLARGEGKAALTQLHDLAPQVDKWGNPLLANSLDMSIGYIAACCGLCDSIPRWLRDGDMTAKRSFYQGATFARVVFGKALMLKKDWVTLEALAQDIPAQFGPHPSLFGHIHALTLEAIAAFHLYGLEEGAACMRRAVELARPDGIDLTIGEYGRHAQPMLKHLAARHPKDAFLNTLARHARLYAQMTGSSRREAETPALTERETLLLSLAAQGKNNVEIAGHLGVSLAAVKKSFSGIYRKLRVRGRAEAVSKAQE